MGLLAFRDRSHWSSEQKSQESQWLVWNSDLRFCSMSCTRGLCWHWDQDVSWTLGASSLHALRPPQLSKCHLCSGDSSSSFCQTAATSVTSDKMLLSFVCLDGFCSSGWPHSVWPLLPHQKGFIWVCFAQDGYLMWTAPGGAASTGQDPPSPRWIPSLLQC